MLTTRDRASGTARPNDIWQADHTELDLMILDGSGEPVGPCLTVILGDRSRAIAGYTVFVGDPSALQTALALRQVIWRKSDPGWLGKMIGRRPLQGV